jgi:ribokinase
VLDKLKHLNIVGSVVVMPDFFVDRIIKLQSKEDLYNALIQKAKFGGGSVRGFPSIDIKGGNAVNIAYCLAKLGIKVSLFTVTDSIGLSILKQLFLPFGDKVGLFVSNGKHGYTTSFEFPENSSTVNVMLSDVGDNANYGPERINSSNEIAALKNADAVMVVNWASNLKGTALAEYAFSNSPKAIHFIDPADIETRKYDFANSLSELSGNTDILSLNENESVSLCSALEFEGLDSSNYAPENVRDVARKLAEKVGISVDLHTKIGSAWSNGKDSVFAYSVKVQAKTLTGAGDSWDAADIVGYLAGLEPKERLIFSNACASLYIRSADGEPPTMDQAVEMLGRMDL